ncbi:hypothetical protein WCLP8_410002 [uncultured Gammaproteobacteria bacterium]
MPLWKSPSMSRTFRSLVSENMAEERGKTALSGVLGLRGVTRKGPEFIGFFAKKSGPDSGYL